MREATLVPLPAIAGSEEAAPGGSGLLAREVVASAVGVAVALDAEEGVEDGAAVRARGGDGGEHLPPRVEDRARTCGAEAGGPALPLRVSSRIGVAIAGRARGVGHHLSPARSAVAREAGAPGSSAVRRLPGGATLRVSVVSRLLLPGLP